MQGAFASIIFRANLAGVAMDFAFNLSLTVLFGVSSTFQAAVIGAITRERGGREASMISPLGSLAVVGVLLLWIAIDEGSTKLPAPLDSWYVVAVAAPLLWAGLWLTIRGLPAWYATAGFAAGIGLALTPRLIGDLGLALYFSAMTFGSGAGALAFDHAGAFGMTQRAVTLSRAGGLALVGAGLVLVRVA